MTKRKASEAAEIEPAHVETQAEDDRTTNVDQVQSTISSTETLVNDVNTLSPEEFRGHYVKDEWLRFIAGSPASPCSFEVRLEHATTLPYEDFNRCLDLLKSTSQRDYEAASCGWNERRKKREMKSPEMYYLLLDRSTTDASASFAGFLSFMVTHDSIPSIPVVYIYEIHLAESVRGGGVGAHLMQIVENIARAVGVQRTMLTCFLANSRARNFYQRQGYTFDPTSPADRTTRAKTIKADYAILSKDVHTQSATSPDQVPRPAAVRLSSADTHDALLGKVGQTADGLHKVPLNPGLENFMNSFQTWTQNLQASQFISVSLRLSVNAQAAQRAGKLDVAAAERARFNRRYQLLKQSNHVAQGFCSLLAEYTARLEKEKDHLDSLWRSLDEHEKAPDASLRSDSGLSNASHMTSVEKSFQAWQTQMSQFENDLHRRAKSLTARESGLERRKHELDQHQAALEHREESLLCLQVELQRQLGMMQRRESFVSSPPQTITLPPKQCTEAGLRLHQTLLAARQQQSGNTSQWSSFDEGEQGSESTGLRVDEWLARTF